MDERTIKILINMGMDEASVKKAISSFEKFQTTIDELETKAKLLKQAIFEAMAQKQPAEKLKAELAGVTKTLELVRQKGAQAFNDGFITPEQRATQEAEKLKQKLAEVRQESMKLRDIGQKLTMIGVGMQNAGRSLLSPLQGAMAAYMEQQQAIKEAGGQMSESAQRYIDAQQQMQEAYTRIGSVAAEKITPFIEDAADLVDRLADFVEKHPEIVTAIGLLGAALTVGGTIVTAVGQFYMGLGVLKDLGFTGSTLKGLGGKAAQLGSTSLIPGAAQAATTTTAARLAMATGKTAPMLMGMPLWAAGGITSASMAAAATPFTLLGGAALGVAGYNYYAAKTGRDSAGEIGSKSLAIAKFKTDQWLRDLGITANKTDKELWEAAKAAAGLGDAAEDAAASTEKTAEELLAEAEAAKKAADANKQFTSALMDFELESKRAEEDYYREREDIQRQGQQAEKDLQRNHYSAMADFASQYQSQIQDLTANYQQAAADADAQYQQARAQAVSEAQQAEQDAREDHLEALRKLEKDHNSSVWKLTQDRDAFGLLEENRRYQDAVNEENRAFQKESERRERELQTRLAEMDTQYQAERAQRYAEYQKQLTDAKAQYEEQVKQENEQYLEEQKRLKEKQAEQLRELDEQYNLERQRRNENFAIQIADLDEMLLNETNRKRYWYQIQQADLEQFISNAKAATTQPATATSTYKASGGYARYGKYTLGEVGTEWVATAQTTKALESMAGGSLTQDRLLALAARGSVSAQKQINVNLGGITFNGEMSAGNKSAFREFIRSVAAQTFDDVMLAA